MPCASTSPPPDPRHPIVAAALAACGVRAEDVLNGSEWRKGETSFFHRNGPVSGPRIICRPDRILIHYPRSNRMNFAIEEQGVNGEPRWVHSLEIGRHLPETVVPLLPGRRLREIVDVPGGDEIVVLEALQDDQGVILTLQTPSGEPLSKG